jgi:methylthioribose-1-phosphate isomerase
VIADNAGGHLMQHGRVDLVIVGADRTSRRGDAANKIGTYLKALAARDNGVPFYVAAALLDLRLAPGGRPPATSHRGAVRRRRSAPCPGWLKRGGKSGCASCRSPARRLNPAFDVTPARLITGLISERGVMRADEADILRLYPERRPERP